VAGTFTGNSIRWATPTRRVAPGQTVALYDAADVSVIGAGIAT
jgi:tRNA U34 2-thiouridine synthase MnmA/TrmU